MSSLSRFPFAATCSVLAVSMTLLAGCGDAARDSDALAGADTASLPISQDILLTAVMAGLPRISVAANALPDPDSRGAQLVAQYCSACHGIAPPTTHSATDWPAVLRRMWLRADRVAPLADLPVPDAAERLVILNYMLDHALRVSAGELPAGKGRDTFTQTCSQCHALPDPASHSSADWPAVVMRMKTHMEDLLNRTLLQDDIADIVFYLQRVSGQSAS